MMEKVKEASSSTSIELASFVTPAHIRGGYSSLVHNEDDEDSDIQSTIAETALKPPPNPHPRTLQFYCLLNCLDVMI